jgi:regulator of PEP synthase PpsR (kinase-PPPase family)
VPTVGDEDGAVDGAVDGAADGSAPGVPEQPVTRTTVPSNRRLRIGRLTTDSVGREEGRMAEPVASVPDAPVVPVFFLSDSTGISAETMGNALLIQFPDIRFERTLFPFITSVEEARRVVALLDEAMDGPVTPLVFTTAADDTVRQELARTRAPFIDFFDIHMSRVEEILGLRGLHEAARLHGVGDIRRYNTRMAAVEFTIEHDDGQSVRGLEKADVILIAPSRCGKTPTSMYLALQHGLFVANYPLVDEDLEQAELPAPVAPYADRCFGLTSSAERLSQVRNERRPGSRYSSLEQCRWELRRASELYAANRIPVIDSSSRSVEEMATLIVQTRNQNLKRAAT